jgi:hypothetical protein
MIKTLVAIEVDLASSMAIRYACQLGNMMNMELHPVYVKAPPPEEPTVGTGWVRRTWEREMVAAGKEEIQEMLASEADTCPTLQEPRVIYGDRDYELLKVVEHEPYGLYVEGAPYPFTPVNIQRRLHSKFYQRLNAPLIWLRVLKKLDQALLVCPDPAATRAVVAAFHKIWEGCPTPVKLAVVSGGSSEALTQAVEQGRDQLTAGGCSAAVLEVAAAEGWGPAPEATRDFGLVAVALEKGIKKESPKLQWLSQIKAPLLLVLY